MLDFEFQCQTRLLFGKDSISKLPEELSKYGAKVLLVTGGKSVHASGLYDRVMADLKKTDKQVFEVSGVKPNPRVDSVREGVAICKKEKIDLILGVGGGSVVDAAKGMAAGALYDGDVWDLYQYKAPTQMALPVGCILTLAATGTEMNGNSVVSNLETGEKFGLVTPLALQPRFSILDPQTTYSVPADQTAYGCVDIMSHVFEQYFSQVLETPLADRLCESILITMVENAPKALKTPKDYDVRANIMWCGTMALNNIVGLGKQGDWATHGMEHELSAQYDIAHGAGLAILFPQWMKHVLNAGPAKFKQYAIRVWGVKTDGKNDREIGLEGIERTKKFFKEIGAPTSLSDVGIKGDKIPEMAKKATRNGPMGSYKRLETKDVEEIMKASL
jgi:alcohol dehydrogenase YqhD (iron-dependent ADH family)